MRGRAGSEGRTGAGPVVQILTVLPAAAPPGTITWPVRTPALGARPPGLRFGPVADYVPGLRAACQQGRRDLTQGRLLDLRFPGSGGVSPAARGMGRRTDRRPGRRRASTPSTAVSARSDPRRSGLRSNAPSAQQAAQPGAPGAARALRACRAEPCSHRFTSSGSARCVPPSSAAARGDQGRSSPARPEPVPACRRPKGRWSRDQVPIGATRGPYAAIRLPVRTPMRRKLR